jgi:hypothetical protein
MAFPWPGKKDAPDPAAAPKREFPAGLDLDSSDDVKSETPKGESPKGGMPKGAAERRVSSSAKPSPSEPKSDEKLHTLSERLEQLGRLLDQSKDQVLSYLLHRESEAGGGEALLRKLDSVTAKLDQLAGGTGRTLDALYGKLDQLSATPSRGGGEGPAAAGPSSADLKTVLRPLMEKLEQVDAKCKSLAAIDALKEAFVPSLVKVRDGLSEQHSAIGGGVRQIQEVLPQYFNALPQYFTALQQQMATVQQRTEAGLRTIVEILRPPEPAGSAAVEGDWREALLGSELASSQALSHPRQQLLSGLLAGDPAASGLIGTLLLFRSAPVEKMSAMLKDVGEAFYRWQPRTSGKPSEMEQALVEWLRRTCEQSGVSNTIELVHPGERFDSGRHNAPRPGVEITQVFGWIVLRDNGKVYTKASVAVK